jgi:hypothetical protein
VTRLLTVQPSSYTDNLWASPDGELVEGTKLPYPLHVNEAGEVQRQDFWRGDPARIIGFTTAVERRAIDLRWEDAWRDPSRAVGMYVVTADSAGRWGTWQLAIQSVEEVEA